jgi:hypothetical protein
MAAAQTMAMTTTQKIIAIAVTIIIISTVAIPIIQDMETSTSFVTEYNTGEKYTATLTEDNVSLTVYYDDGLVYVNDYSFTPTTYSVVLFSDTFVVRYNGNDNKFVASGSADTTQYKTDALTVSSKTLAFTDADSNDHSWTFSKLMYAAENGEYGVFVGSGVQFTANKDAKIYLPIGKIVANNSDLSPSSVDTIGVFKGSNGLLEKDWFASRTSDTTVNTASAVISNYTDNGNGTYSISIAASSVVINTGVGAYSATMSATSGYCFFAPMAYKVPETELSALIGIIPILLILVPLMMAVRMMVLKRN